MKTKILLSLVLILILQACVEGRSGTRSSSELSGEESSSVGTVEEQREIAYSEQDFDSILMELEDLFNKSFTTPTHIVSKVQCPDKILTQANYDLYSDYVEQLVLAKVKYQSAVTSLNSAISKETNSSNREILMEVKIQLSDEKSDVLSQLSACNVSLSSFSGGGTGEEEEEEEEEEDEEEDNGGGNTQTCTKTEAELNTLAQTRYNQLLAAQGSGNSITDANNIFNPPPAGALGISFSNVNDLINKVTCKTYIKYSAPKGCDSPTMARLLTISSYINGVLHPMNGKIAAAYSANKGDLLSSNDCTKKIAQKSKVLLENKKIEFTNKYNLCESDMIETGCPIP